MEPNEIIKEIDKLYLSEKIILVGNIWGFDCRGQLGITGAGIAESRIGQTVC